MEEYIKKQIYKASEVILLTVCLCRQMALAVDWISKCFCEGGKLLLFGNGGSAADAQHIAAELMGKFKIFRSPLPVVALTTDTSILTAWANDVGFQHVFDRQVEALAKPGDIVMGISTSGNSKNVILGIEMALAMDAKTIALTGGDGGRLAQLAQLSLIVSSYDTPRIQEAHIVIGHILCELVERELFANASKLGVSCCIRQPIPKVLSKATKRVKKADDLSFSRRNKKIIFRHKKSAG